MAEKSKVSSKGARGPYKAPGEHRTQRVAVNFTESEKADLEAIAEAAGQKLGAWLHDLALTQLSQGSE